MCQDLSCGTKAVTSGADDHRLHWYQSVNVISKFNSKNSKLKLSQNETSQETKIVETGGGGGTLLVWRIVG